MRRLALLAAALVAAGSWAADPPPPAVEAVKLPEPAKPAEVKTAVGVPVRLAAAGGKAVRWAAGCELCGRTWYLLPDSGGAAATVMAAKPGRFLVLTYTAAGDVATEATKTVVVAGDAEPDVPTPPVPPAPLPPTPLPPTPLPPTPADPFKDKVKAAYLADGTTAKKGDKADTLRVLYEQAALLCLSEKVPTPAKLVEAVRSTAEAFGLAAADLAGVRALVAAELAGAGDPNKAFDSATRPAVAAVYRRAAAALAGLS